MSVVIEKPYRSMLKAVSWRMTGTLDTMVVSFIVTKSFKLAFSIGVIEVVTKMVLYYFHERVWARLKIGRVVEENPEYTI